MCTYTGTGANTTVAHGLGVAPAFMIIKNRSAAENWRVYHKSLGATQYMGINSTAAASTDSTTWNNTAPTTSVFSLGSENKANGSGNLHVAYLWAEVPGFSKFGSYTGNGSADGPFVYTGFKPAMIILKRTDTTQDWIIGDNMRDGYNCSDRQSFPNLSSAESASACRIDYLSNGFKMRNAASAETNASGGTYIYAAFAEQPFKYARGR